MPEQDPASPNIESLLNEFAGQAESWFKDPFVVEYNRFFKISSNPKTFKRLNGRIFKNARTTCIHSIP